MLVYDTLECAEVMMHASSLKPRHSPDALFSQNGTQDGIGHGNASVDAPRVDAAATTKVGSILISPTDPTTQRCLMCLLCLNTARSYARMLL